MVGPDLTAALQSSDLRTQQLLTLALDILSYLGNILLSTAVQLVFVAAVDLVKKLVDDSAAPAATSGDLVSSAGPLINIEAAELVVRGPHLPRPHGEIVWEEYQQPYRQQQYQQFQTDWKGLT